MSVRPRRVQWRDIRDVRKRLPDGRPGRHPEVPVALAALEVKTVEYDDEFIGRQGRIGHVPQSIQFGEIGSRGPRRAFRRPFCDAQSPAGAAGAVVVQAQLIRGHPRVSNVCSAFRQRGNLLSRVKRLEEIRSLGLIDAREAPWDIVSREVKCQTVVGQERSFVMDIRIHLVERHRFPPCGNIRSCRVGHVDISRGSVLACLMQEVQSRAVTGQVGLGVVSVGHV